jgi:AAA+ ATPase superfamily predicted ATPase
MENQVLGYKSPLYGRRTAQFKVLPFGFDETLEYLDGGFSPQDAAVLYGATGGIPLYVSLIDEGLSVAENIMLNFLSPAGYLFEEPTNLIKQECREPARYNAIIKAVSDGASRLSTIAGKAGMETSLCSTYISKLISIGILKKEYPFREERGKKTIYRLSDGMFRFWYRFIPNNMSLIQRRQAKTAYDRIERHIPDFMGAVFEDICLSHLWRLNIAGRTPFPFVDAGRWWGNNPTKREECEIDIVADDDGSHAIFAECKWTDDVVRTDVLDALMEKSEIFRYASKHYFLFAKSGFSQGVRSQASALGNVTLVSLGDMTSSALTE